MKINLKLLLILMFFLMLLPEYGNAQYSTKKVKSINEQYTDSIKQIKYDYIFPIWGQKVYSKGFDIPYPIGAMANFIYMKQNIVIDNFQLGFKTDKKDVPLTPVDFIDFGENISTVHSFNVRPDVWVFPFLNVYGLFGTGNSKTEVNLIAPINLQSVVEQNVTTKGFGVMAAGGIGPIWFSVDANWTWNKPELLDNAVQVKVLGIRLGKTFVSKTNPERNFAIWAGGMRTKMDADTSGQITLGEAIPDLENRADEIVADYNNWYNNIATPPQQVVADRVLTPIVDAIGNIDGSGIIRYGMDKQVQQLWNGIIGAQFQLNKRWQFRTEGGIIGNRKSFLLSANYRFLL